MAIAVAPSACGDQMVDPGEDSPPADLRGGGAVTQRGQLVGRIEAMSSCRSREARFRPCAERRDYPRTTLPALRDVRRHGVRVTVPRSHHVEVRALRDGRVLPGWRSAQQIIDYGVIDDWSATLPGEGFGPHDRPPPRRADALRIVAYGGDAQAKGFELALP